MEELELPIYPETAYYGDLGVRIVESIICDDLGMVFRRKDKTDLGIDAEVEIITNDRRGTGRLLAFQIKCGNSFFKETTVDGYIFRCSISEFNYWINCSLPVILAICHPVTHIVFWTQISLANAKRLEKSYRIIIPFDHELNKKSEFILNDIANHLQPTDIVELSLFKFLYEKYKENIKICPLIEEPKDFHGLSYIAEMNNSLYMVGLLYDQYGKISTQDIEKYKVLFHENMKSMAWDIYSQDAKLLLFIVSKSKDVLCLNSDIKNLIDCFKVIEVYRLVYSDAPFFTLTELDDNNNEINFYE